MKAKKTVTPKARLAQEKPANFENFDARAEKPAPPAPAEIEPINLDDLQELRILKDFLDNALSPSPRVLTLEDESHMAYKRFDALMTCWGSLDTALEAEHSELVEPLGHYMEGMAKMEVQKIRLAAKALFEVYQAESGKAAAREAQQQQRSAN